MSKKKRTRYGATAAIVIGLGVTLQSIGAIAGIASWIEANEQIILEIKQPVKVILADQKFYLTCFSLISCLALIGLAIWSFRQRQRCVVMEKEATKQSNLAKGRLELLSASHTKSHLQRDRTQQLLLGEGRRTFSHEIAFNNRKNWIESNLDHLTKGLSAANGAPVSATVKFLSSDLTYVTTVFSDRPSMAGRRRTRSQPNILDAGLESHLKSDPSVRRQFLAEDISKNFKDFASAFGPDRARHYEHYLSVPLQYFDENGAPREELDFGSKSSAILGSLAIDSMKRFSDAEAFFEIVSDFADSIYEELLREIDNLSAKNRINIKNSEEVREFLAMRWRPRAIGSSED